MTIIEHGGHTVEAETIEMVFLQPVLTIGKEEVEHLVLAIVKAK